MSILGLAERTSKRRKTHHESDEDVSDQEQPSNGTVPTEHKPRILTRNSTIKTNDISSRTMNKANSQAVKAMTQSSVMAVQASELVSDIACGEQSKLRSIQPALDDIIQAIKAIPEQPASSLLAVEKRLRKQGIAIPFAGHRPASDIKYSFSFTPVSEVFLRGLLPSGLATKDHKSVEIAVQMPPSAFHEKDFLNHRAFNKRAYYVACLATALSSSLKSQYKLKYDLLDGNTLLPVLRISSRSRAEAMDHPEITINVLLDRELGAISKMLPTKNCVRTTSGEQDTSITSVAPTPVYNSTLRLNASTVELDQLIEKASRKCDAFRDSCLLGQVWLRQQGFASSRVDGGFGAYEWILMTALLLIGGGHRGQPLFSVKYTSIQLFKAILQVLSGRDLTKSPIVIGGQIQALSEIEIPVLFDMDHGVNVMSGMTQWSYLRLRQMSQLSLSAMNARNQNNFDATFLVSSSNVLLQFDEIYRIEFSEQVIRSHEDQEHFLSSLYSILNRGLGDRARLINLSTSKSAPWSLNEEKPENADHRIQIGLLVDPDTAARTLDHGPTAEEQDEARQFRAFWGEKSELRRFRDGRITETLVWSDKRPVTAQIIEYLCLSHFKTLPSSVIQVTQELASKFLAAFDPIPSVDAFKIMNSKYQELASRLHQLEGLPLPIRSVSPSDPCLRSAAIKNPLAASSSSPIGILIQFDSTARWPDHLPAIQYTKIAFLTKLADLLTEAHPSYSTRVGIENTNSSTTGLYNTSFLDVIESASAPAFSALVFRLRIHHERELDLLQSQIASKTASNNVRESVTSAITTFRRNFIASTSHTAGVRNLVTHFAPFSDTTRLLKYWTASHHLTNHLPEPIIELITAHVFLHPYPWSVPGTSTTAFLRCLHFLAHWDWASTPLIVDLTLTQEMPAAAYAELETRFLAWRKLDPAMSNVAWFIGTNLDNTGTIWTQGARPPRVIATRVSALARASIDYIRNKDDTIQPAEWSDLFESGVEEFDFVIHMNASVVKGSNSRDKKNGVTKYKNLVVQEEMDVDKIGHDPVQLYLDDLESAFGTSILFFHGHGGKVITGLWKPGTVGIKEWRVRLGYSSLPVSSTSADTGDKQDTCAINKDGIIAEIAKLGEGMVERIELRR